jgi:hypothetical protein
MSLDDLSDKDPEMYTHLHGIITKAATEWCLHHLNQQWVDVWEVGEVPNYYSGGIHGYSIIVKTDSFPQGKQIEVLIAPNQSLSVREIQ